jgi:hypothetical protein
VLRGAAQERPTVHEWYDGIGERDRACEALGRLLDVLGTRTWGIFRVSTMALRRRSPRRMLATPASDGFLRTCVRSVL